MNVLSLLEEFRGRIIDIHSHIGSDQRFLLEGSEDYIIRVMNRYGIKVAFVSGTHSLVADFRIGNQHVMRAIKRYPGRFVGLVAVNPYYKEEGLEEMRKYLRMGFKGVKMHSVYFNLPLTDELYLRVFNEAEKLKVPVMAHSYDGGIEVSKVADLYPNLTIVMYHMGGVKWREGIERVKEYDNVYAEISSSVTDRGMVEKAVEVLGYERVLFGIDMPYLDPAVPLGKVLGAEISKKAKEAILCENALKFLRV